MDFSIQGIIKVAGDWCYGALALCALYGAYCAIMVTRRIKQKRFPSNASANRFLDDMREQLQQRNFDVIAETCDSPAYWSKAVPQLILVALQNRNLGVGKLRHVNAAIEKPSFNGDSH